MSLNARRSWLFLNLGRPFRVPSCTYAPLTAWHAGHCGMSVHLAVPPGTPTQQHGKSGLLGQTHKLNSAEIPPALSLLRGLCDQSVHNQHLPRFVPGTARQVRRHRQVGSSELRQDTFARFWQPADGTMLRRLSQKFLMQLLCLPLPTHQTIAWRNLLGICQRVSFPLTQFPITTSPATCDKRSRP